MANKNGLTHQTFIPITKIDEENRLVFARLTDETVDLAGEIMDYATSKPLFEAWSQHQDKVTGGKSKGNLRAMHQPIAAGKFIEVSFDDVAKSIDTVAHVVDDAEWKKVQAGVYSGLSLGGNIVGKMWKDEATGAMRYTVRPVEGSLVDLPCNPNATIEHFKAGGMSSQVALTPWQPKNEDVATEAAVLEKAAGEQAQGRDFIAEARAALILRRADEASPEPLPDAVEAVEEPKAVDPAEQDASPAGDPEKPGEVDYEPHQKWLAVDGKAFDTKRECREHNDSIKALEAKGVPALKAALDAAKAAANPATDDAGDGGGGCVTADFQPERLKALATILTEAETKHGPALVEKGLYEVGRLARVVEQFASLQMSSAWEAEWEGDNSAMPATLAALVAQAGQALIDMATEEVAEIVAAMAGDDGAENVIVFSGDDDIYLAAGRELDAIKANEAVMTKAGARNSKKDADAIQRMHDDAISLGAACSAEKAAGAPLVKIAELETEKAALEGQIAEAIPGIAELGDTVKTLTAELTKANGRIEELAKGPAPMPVLRSDTRVVGKSEDNGGAPDAAAITKDALSVLMASEVGRKMLIDAATDAALNNPRQVLQG